MDELSNFKLAELMKSHSKDNLVRSLQVNLGYHPNTYIPSIDEFIEDDYYLGKITYNGKGIYKYWREVLRDLFPSPLYVNYNTIFLRSAIGTGKSSIARIIILYTMAKMILMESPHEFFKLMPNKDLVVFLYALQKSTINGAMYNPLIEMIDDSPFFKSHMDYNRKGYHFKNKICIKTGSNIGKNVGLDIFAVFMDEMQEERIRGENKRNYDSLKARIQSRFMMSEGMYFNSIMVLSGSPGSSASFVEKLTEKSRKHDNVLIINTPQWEVLKDKIKYSGETFKVFVGNSANNPKILEDDKELEVYKGMLGEDEEHKIIDVPIEYRKHFEDDILIAIRDLAGSITRSTHDFITNVEKLKESYCFDNRFFNIGVIKLPFYDPTQIKDYFIDKNKSVRSRLLNPDNYRFIHIDIGVVSDLTGIAMSHIAGFINTKIDENISNNEVMDPWYINDFNIGISRNKNEETSISKIRDFILFLRDSGVNIHTVTVDGYQSTQLRQELLMNSVNCEVLSITRTSQPFDLFKRALYSSRIQLAKNHESMKEFTEFKKVIKSNGKLKVVHPSTSETGSHGDIAEAIVGSIYSAYKRHKSGIDVLSGFSKLKEINKSNDGFIEVNENNIYSIMTAM